MKRRYEFAYCNAVEIPLTKTPLERDTFSEGLTLNYEEIEAFDVCAVKQAKLLAKAACGDAVELVDVSLPVNVVDLDAHRHERNRPTAA